jgi:hypothetical protein
MFSYRNIHFIKKRKPEEKKNSQDDEFLKPQCSVTPLATTVGGKFRPESEVKTADLSTC